MVLAVQDERGIPQVALVLAALSWPAMLRLMRIAVVAQRQTGYVEAARALGAGRWRILRRHVIGVAVGPVLVYATALTGAIIAAEATLSFMGVGLQLPAISWGLQLAAAQGHIGQAPHLLFPGGLVVLAVLGTVLMGDVVRDAFDPRSGADYVGRRTNDGTLSPWDDMCSAGSRRARRRCCWRRSCSTRR